MAERVERGVLFRALGTAVVSSALCSLAPLSALAKEDQVKQLTCPIYYWHEVEDAGEFQGFVESLLANDYLPVAMRDVADYFYDDTQVWPKEKKPAVITFDDGRLSQFETALPILDQYRLRATFFVLQNYADGVNKYVDDGQIKTIAQGGWEAAVHGYTHRPLPFLRIRDHQAWEDDIVAAKSRLEDLIGKKVVSFAYP